MINRTIGAPRKPLLKAALLTGQEPFYSTYFRRDHDKVEEVPGSSFVGGLSFTAARVFAIGRFSMPVHASLIQVTHCREWQRSTECRKLTSRFDSGTERGNFRSFRILIFRSYGASEFSHQVAALATHQISNIEGAVRGLVSTSLCYHLLLDRFISFVICKLNDSLLFVRLWVR